MGYKTISGSKNTSLLHRKRRQTARMLSQFPFQQVHGTAMGSRVSVVVADLVMEDVESRALATFSSPSHFWKRYVVDTCCVLRTDRPSHHQLSLEYRRNILFQSPSPEWTPSHFYPSPFPQVTQSDFPFANPHCCTQCHLRTCKIR